jgi:hypothetical protein
MWVRRVGDRVALVLAALVIVVVAFGAVVVYALGGVESELSPSGESIVTGPTTTVAPFVDAVDVFRHVFWQGSDAAQILPLMDAEKSCVRQEYFGVEGSEWVKDLTIQPTAQASAKGVAVLRTCLTAERRSVVGTMLASRRMSITLVSVGSRCLESNLLPLLEGTTDGWSKLLGAPIHPETRAAFVKAFEACT